MTLEPRSTPLEPSAPDVSGVGGHDQLALIGDLDVATAPLLRALLESAVAGEAPVVMVDASAVAFIDCSGLAPLLEAAERLRQRGAALQVVRPSPVVRLVASLVGTCEELGPDREDSGPGVDPRPVRSSRRGLEPVRRSPEGARVGAVDPEAAARRPEHHRQGQA